MTGARGIMAVAGLAALAGCADTPVAAVPAPSLTDGPYVSVLRPAGVGHVITADGAVPIEGATLAIYSPTAPLRYDQGKIAKDVAVRACAARGMRFNPAAVGRFEAPNWVFPGACR